MKAEALAQTSSLPISDTRPQPVAQRKSPILLLTIGVCLAVGWIFIFGLEYDPGSDLGYNLGLIGGSMMLVLLLYPLRKRVGFMRNWLPVKHWFRGHMYLGMFGPILILLHSKLTFGSINGTIAFICMAIVFFSGLFGRYVYTKIHHGLYGRNMTLGEVKQKLGITVEGMRSKFDIAPEVKQRLTRFEASVADPVNGSHGIKGLLILGIRTGVTYWLASRELKRVLTQIAQTRGLDDEILLQRIQKGNKMLKTYLFAIREVAEFSAYERLFSYWHLLHIPLLFLLILTGVIHVIAVHMY